MGAPKDAASAKGCTDASLLAAASNGDREAIAALYDRHAAFVNGIAFALLRSADVAEDVTHDVFEHIWRRAPVLEERGADLRAWLYTVTKNRCLDLLKTRRGRAASLTAFVIDLTPAKSAVSQPEQALDLLELRVRVRKALEQLPEEQRAAIELAFFKGITHREISSRTGVSLGTTKGRIRLAIEKLRELLAGSEGDP